MATPRLRQLSWVGAGALAVMTLMAAGGCGGKSKGDTTEGLMKGNGDGPAAKVDPTLCETEGKKIVTSDLNRDNRPDVWRLYGNVEEGETTVEVQTCQQVDFNYDGRKDYVVAYNPKGATVFEKFDFDFDGKFDAFYQFDEKSGKVFEVQRESGFDNRYDVQEVYDETGTLKTVKLDRNADGEPDMWEQYVKGDLVAILYDDDYDSKVDRREEVKLDKPAKPSPGNDQATDTGAGEDDDAAGEGDDAAGEGDDAAGEGDDAASEGDDAAGGE